MSRIFITGAQGFVGQNLVKMMESKGLPFLPSARHWPDDSGLSYGDLSEHFDWSKHLDSSISAVVHLAARVHIMHDHAESPLTEFLKINCDAALRLANAAKAAGIKRFVYLSSVKVNGEETFTKPFSADDTPRPEDDYGQSKYEAEKKLLSLHEPGQFEVVIIRPPLVYGPGVKANFAQLMNWVRRGYPIPFGLVKNKRSLVSVLNLCDLILTVCSHPAAAGQIFIVSDDDDLSIKDLIKKMALAQKRSVRLIPIPVQVMKVAFALIGKKNYSTRLFGNLQVDITKTKKLLNWKPPFTFVDTFTN